MKNVGNLLKNSKKFYFIWHFKLKAVRSIQSEPNTTFSANTAGVLIRRGFEANFEIF